MRQGAERPRQHHDQSGDAQPIQSEWKRTGDCRRATEWNSAVAAIGLKIRGHAIASTTRSPAPDAAPPAPAFAVRGHGRKCGGWTQNHLPPVYVHKCRGALAGDNRGAAALLRR
jgi:hypothetical protein